MGIVLKKFIFILFVSFIVLSVEEAKSQISITGGKGLCRVLEADPITPADIFLNTNITSFMEQEGQSVALAKYYRFNINLTVGLANYLECYLNFVPYQDNQRNLWGQIGDTQLGLKYLTPLSSKVFKFGLAGHFKFPSAKYPNVPFEVFSTDKPAWAIKALLSLDFLPIMPNFPMKFNLNFGYLDHDIYDQYFSSKIDQLIIGTGLKYSIRSIQFYTEYSGEIFFNNPAHVAFNQNSMRITQGIRFLGPWNNTIHIAFDFAFTQYDSLENLDIFHKKYSDWRAMIGISHRFSVYKYFDKTAKLEKERRLRELRKLEAIRKKRQNVKQDLKKMQNELKKGKKKGNHGKTSG